MTIRYRLLTTQDLPEAVRLTEELGWNQTAHDWQRPLVANPEGCFAAESEGRLIGTATTIVYENRVGWIGMVVVDPGHQGRGIGTTLLRRAVDHLTSRGIPSTKLDATPRGKPLYERLGFTVEFGIERWLLTRATEPRTVAPSLFSLAQVFPLDREAFGVDRRALLRSLAAEAPEYALLARRGTGVAGFALARRGARADQLGPWISHDEDTAADLLDEFLRRSGRKHVFVDCVEPNRHAARLLERRGFVLSRSLTRMFLGTNPFAGRPELVWGILGPAFG